MTRSLSRSSGNAFIYVLIAVVLLGGLTFALSRNQDANPSSTITDGAAKAAAMQILAYEASAKTAIDNMLQTGVTVDQIDFTLPSSGTFNTAPNTYKLFHPDGGGLQYKALPRSSNAAKTNPSSNYYIGRFNTHVSSTSSQTDIVFSAFGITAAVCLQLNKQITGSAANYSMTAGNSLRMALVDKSIFGGGSNSNVTSGNCPGCVDRPALCLQETDDPTKFAFYSLLVSR